MASPLASPDLRGPVALGGEAVIVVAPVGCSRIQLAGLATGNRDRVEPAAAVEQEIAAVRRPVGRFEMTPCAVDNPPLPARETDRFQCALDNSVLGLSLSQGPEIDSGENGWFG